MAKGNVKVTITGDASGAKRAFREVGDAGGGLGSKLGTLTKSIGKVAGAMGVMYGAYKVVDFFKDSAEAALEDAKAKTILHTAIKNITKATDAELDALDQYIEKTQAATGFTEEELRPAMVKLTEATKDVGEAQKLMAIAMDVATARGAPLETVVLALEKAQNGQLTSLQRLGVATKDASGATLSFDKILQNLADTYGGTTAAAADTLAGKMKRFQLILGEVKEGIGAALMPALEKMATVIMDNLPTIEELGGILGEVAASVLELVAPIIEALLPALRDLMSLWQTVWPLLKSVLNLVAPAIGTILSGIVTAINAIIRSVTWLLDKIGLLKKESAGMGIGGATSSSKDWRSDIIKIKPGVPNKLPQFASGGPVPGSGPVPIIAHGGEYVTSKADMAAMLSELRAIKEVLIQQPQRQKLAMRTA